MESLGLGLLGLLVIAGGIVASIALHEVGHLVPAKRFGVKCSQYMIGFGPTVWSTKRGETEYGVKAIPLGGYVRMLGMFPPKPGRPARADSTGRLGLLVDQARSDAQRDIGPEDGDRLFYQRSVPQRLVIMLGGPVMNLLIAVVLFTVLLTTVGQDVQKPVVQSVSQCVLPVATSSQETQRTACEPTDRPAPAAAAGLRSGDRIVSFAGAPIDAWSDLQTLIRANPDRTVPITVVRDGREVALEATLIRDNRPVQDKYGALQRDDDGRLLLEPVGFLGVSPVIVRETVPVTQVPGQIGEFVERTTVAVLGIPSRVEGILKAAFGSAERDPNGPISVVGVGRIGVEVAVADAAFSDKLATWVGVIASVNLALFVFNLLPLLPLDGGHVAGALWEALRRRFARLRRRPDPGPVDIARLLPLTYVVASVLFAFSLLLIYADIVNPIRIAG